MSTINIDKNRSIAAPGEAVWALVSDFYALHTWLPGVTETRKDEATSSRHAVLPDGSAVIEQLLEQTERSQRYAVTGGPMPVKDFVAHLEVRDAAGGASEVVWTASFEPVGMPAADVEALIAGNFDAGLDSLQTLATRAS